MPKGGKRAASEWLRVEIPDPDPARSFEDNLSILDALEGWV